MIEFEFKGYCNKCPNLVPIVDKLYSNGDVYAQYVTCEHKAHCDRIEEHIRKELEKEKKKNV